MWLYADIDECSEGVGVLRNGGCSQTCNNTVGSHVCLCMVGYQLSNNGFTCDVRHLAVNL